MIARMSARLGSGPDVFSDFQLEQSFHSSCRGAGNFPKPSFRSACGRTGNFFLCSCKEKSHQERKHAAWHPRFYAWISGKAAQIPITCASRQRDGVSRHPSRTSSGHQCCLYRQYYLKAAQFYAPTSWTGTVPAFADLQDVKPGAPRHVLSLGDFSLHEQRKVTRSPQASGSSACQLWVKKEPDSSLRRNDEAGAQRHV